MSRGDLSAVVRFLGRDFGGISLAKKTKLIYDYFRISRKVDCPHTNEEMLSFASSILSLSDSVKGAVVEAGCYKGGSGSKFSLAARLAGRQLYLFDSFQGLPDHTEPHRVTIFGKPVTFTKGEYCGTQDEVRSNITKYGSVDSCRFFPGWFDETLPRFHEPVAAIYLDVDLVSSVKTCLKHFYPLLEKGGSLYCQDGHLPLVVETFGDDSFWKEEVGFDRPHIEGLGEKKLIRIVKQ